MTTRNMCGKQHGVWGAQKPCAMRADTSIDFPSLTRAFSTCSKTLLFEQPYYRKFTDACGCNPMMDGFTVCRRLKEQAEAQLIPIIIMTALDAKADRIRPGGSEG